MRYTKNSLSKYLLIVLTLLMCTSSPAKAEDGLKEGMLAPNFVLNDINGKELSLNSLRGKYVVLDFWGSWCIWCIRGVPKMKEYYEKYAGKYEVLGIDCRDSESKWKDAVEFYKLPWLHVYNPSDSKLLADYGIKGFPTKIIIDPQGRVDKVLVGESEAFYQYLDQLFQGQ